MSGSLYWIGATKEVGTKNWHWIDGLQINQSELIETIENITPESSSGCLALRWRTWNNISDLYWTPSTCHQPGRYICKKSAVVLPQNLNQTFQGSYGIISSVNFPQHYPNNLKYTLTIKGRPFTRIYISFTHLILEEQDLCMYDYISLQSDLNGPETRFCGQHQNDLDKFIFFSDNSTAFLTFRSDYSVTATGFQATWKAVDISACLEIQHITVTHKTIYISNNYPEGYLPNLHCVAQFRAPRKKILLTFFDIDVGISEGSTSCKRDYVKVTLESGRFPRSIVLCGNTSVFPPGYQVLSYDSNLTLELFTSRHGGRGFNVTLEMWNGYQVETVLNFNNMVKGMLQSMNYPHSPPESVNYTQQIVTPIGTYIILYFSKTFWNEGSCDENFVTVRDVYQESNYLRTLCAESNAVEKSIDIEFQSLFHSIHLSFWTSNKYKKRSPFTIAFKVVSDLLFLNKSLGLNTSHSLDGCFCENGGSCSAHPEGGFQCKCTSNFTGLFCHIPWCTLNPCGDYGTCNIIEHGYRCNCYEGYTGDHCDQFVTPCDPSPCGQHGDCSVVNNTTHCRCHAMYEGPRCSQYVIRITYKPLSQRMLEEPFWLGLITVSAVLLVILLVYCIKRKFAEKIEKFFAEEIERSKN
ncbi:cubilin-like, partial [Limulus polyphemus]|uniref:Cubilin-like n=1 Tax=Limulus polyphemus TaxID=6850 RepID=A0ABM1SLX1_LIMPO